MEKQFENTLERMIFTEAEAKDEEPKKDEPEDDTEPEGDAEPEDSSNSSMEDFFSQGKAVEIGFEEGEADPKELKAGILVEMEHTEDPKISKKIAIDHLAEIADYYTRLAKMESGAKTDESLDEKLVDMDKIKDWLRKLDKKSQKAIQNFLMVTLGL